MFEAPNLLLKKWQLYRHPRRFKAAVFHLDFPLQKLAPSYSILAAFLCNVLLTLDYAYYMYGLNVHFTLRYSFI
jgi:hypothetical protein